MTKLGFTSMSIQHSDHPLNQYTIPKIWDKWRWRTFLDFYHEISVSIINISIMFVNMILNNVNLVDIY